MSKISPPFQIVIYRLQSPAPSQQLDAQTPRQPFPVTFEAVFTALESWPRMFIEPDGSFVWVGEERDADGTSVEWQLDGHLYDRDERLLFIELLGCCPRPVLEQVIAVLEVPLEEVLVEQRREGTYLSGREFLSS